MALLVATLACAPAVHRVPEVSKPPAPQPTPTPEALPRGYALYQSFCISCHSLVGDPYDKSDRWAKMYLNTKNSSDEELLRRLDDRASSTPSDQDRKDFITFLRSLERKE